ncbi:MAG: hypothetical protein R3F42_11545 [Pseudomonadota bacterium]
MPATLMLIICTATGMVGMLYLLVPGWVPVLERRLNAPCGGRELVSLRIGMRGEQWLEQALNREVLTPRIVWDGWLLRHPRLAGAGLCLLAPGLGLQL